MRILLVSPKGDGAWFSWLLAHEGHDVDVTICEEKDRVTLQGIIPPLLTKSPDPASYDLVVYDSSGHGDSADAARLLTPTVGSSAFADRLEEDRVFGLEAMEKAGIKVPKWKAFASADDAIKFLHKNNRRYVLKPIGDIEDKSTTYVAKSAADMIQFIEIKLNPKVKSFVLQEYIEGVEVSTEAWWTGEEWVALDHDLEEKKFMNGGVGPNTGCSGSVIWMPPRKTPLFEHGLAKVEDQLRENGFVGIIDLNTIVTEGEAWGLEWTPRFGYECTCNLTRLLPMGFGDFLYDIAIGKAPTMGEPRGKFSATVRISVPPYPFADTNRRKVQVPIKGVDLECLESLYLCDVMKEGDELITSGNYNGIGSPIGVGATIGGAFDEVYAAIKRLDIPDLQYRTDIRECVEKRYAQLASWGWLRGIG